MPAVIDNQLYTNNAVSLLAAPISQIATSLTVISGHGAKFPNPTLGQWFLVTLENQAATAQEIVKVTARVGDVFTIERAQEGTTAQMWSAAEGDDTLVDHRVTAGTMRRVSNGYSNVDNPELTDLSGAVDKLFTLFQMSGSSLYDQPFTFEDNKLTLEQSYVPGSVRLYIGGLRQKRGVDFTETGPDELTLTFDFTQDMIDDGQNVVVDFIPN